MASFSGEAKDGTGGGVNQSNNFKFSDREPEPFAEYRRRKFLFGTREVYEVTGIRSKLYEIPGACAFAFLESDSNFEDGIC